MHKHALVYAFAALSCGIGAEVGNSLLLAFLSGWSAMGAFCFLLLDN